MAYLYEVTLIEPLSTHLIAILQKRMIRIITFTNYYEHTRKYMHA